MVFVDETAKFLLGIAEACFTIHEAEISRRLALLQ